MEDSCVTHHRGGPEGHVDTGSRRCSGLAFLASKTLGGCTAPPPSPRASDYGGRPIVPAFLHLYPEVMVQLSTWTLLCPHIPLSMKVRGLPCSSFKGKVLFPPSRPHLRRHPHSDPLQVRGPRDTPLQLGPSSGIQAGNVS